jgi:hypothetical protein
MNFCVKLPAFSGGVPGGEVAAMASNRDPSPLGVIEDAAKRAVKSDQLRAWRFVRFADSPLPEQEPTGAIVWRVAQAGQNDKTLKTKMGYRDPNWFFTKRERVRDGRIVPAEPPTGFATEAEAQQTIDRYHRLGTEAGVPQSNHLQYAVVVEWAEFAAGGNTVVREQRAISAEVEVAEAERLAQEATAALERAREAAREFEPQPAETDWTSAGVPNVQRRTLADGSVRWRGRVAGKPGPTLNSEAEAVAWVEQQKAMTS